LKNSNSRIPLNFLKLSHGAPWTVSFAALCKCSMKMFRGTAGLRYLPTLSTNLYGLWWARRWKCISAVRGEWWKAEQMTASPACLMSLSETSFSRNALFSERTAFSLLQNAGTSKMNLSNRNRHVIYKGKGIKIFRLLVRMKIAQLSVIAATAVPLATYASQVPVVL